MLSITFKVKPLIAPAPPALTAPPNKAISASSELS